MMASEYAPIDLSKGNLPDLAELAEEVHRTKRPRVLRRADGEDVAVLMPAQNAKLSKRQRKKAFSREDSLWNIVGIARSGLTDVSANKHKYLAEAYLSEAKKA